MGEEAAQVVPSQVEQDPEDYERNCHVPSIGNWQAIALCTSLNPDSLDQLVTSVVNSVPLDLYNDKPLIYRRIGDGYLLYSVYQNGVDDGGTDVDGAIVKGEWQSAQEREPVPENQADLAIRMPLPAFEFPTAKAGE